jgi:hypothetical protein
MSWWDELWLNEGICFFFFRNNRLFIGFVLGFAQFLEYFVIEQMYSSTRNDEK